MDDVGAKSSREQDIQAIKQRIAKAFTEELEEVSRQVASKVATNDLLGQFEYDLRDRMLRLGSQALQAGLDEVKKKTTEALATCAHSAARN